MTATAKTREWLDGIGLELKAADDATRTFQGLAAAWSLDQGGDVIHRGAFARTLEHWTRTKARRPIYLLDGHDWLRTSSVVGKMVQAEETDDGLLATFEMIPDDPTADAAYRRVKGGYVTALSIGYTPVRWEYKADGDRQVRHLLEVKLHETSLVVFPMNEDARINAASVKSILAKASLSDADREELTALLAPKAPALATPEPALFDPLRAKLLQLQLHRLATRASGPARVGV